MPDPFTTTAHMDIGPAWAERLRERAAGALEGLSEPAPNVEDWRFTPTERLSLAGLTLHGAGDRPDAATLEPLLQSLGARSGLAITWETGAVVLEDFPGGSLTTFDADAPAPGPVLSGSLVPVDEDIFAALNARHWLAGVHVRADRSATPGAPVVIVHWVSSSEVVTLPRTLVTAAPMADVDVVEVWMGGEAATGSLVAPVTEIVAADGANVDHVALQQLPDTVNFVGHLAAEAKRDAQVTVTCANLGGGLGRYRPDLRMTGTGASAHAYGVYVGSDERHVDFRTRQLHAASHTTSDLLFRGAVWDASSAIYSGLIRIDAEASECDANQASHYLILSDEAKASNIPKLEILNHDVRCGHSSSGGPPDPEQAYYLESRGISPAVARRLIVDGFFADVVARIPVKAVRGVIGREVQDRLAIMWGGDTEERAGQDVGRAAGLGAPGARDERAGQIRERT